MLLDDECLTASYNCQIQHKIFNFLFYLFKKMQYTEITNTYETRADPSATDPSATVCSAAEPS